MNSQITELDPIVIHTVRDARTLGCLLCDHTIDVPDVPVSNELGAVFGMTGDTFARVHVGNVLKQVSREMRAHLEAHSVIEWLEAVAKTKDDVTTCQLCRRPRTPLDTVDYNPIQAITGQPLGWYSADDGEICPQCMERTVRGQL